MTRPPATASRRVLWCGSTALLTVALAAAVTFTAFTGSEPIVSSAQAQDVSLNVQFRTALEPHGRWQRHGRWGDVWIPSKRDRDWRPYTVGRWTFTDQWGWYWVSDEDFGWVTYHYGRWVRTPEYGWVWIPGETWGPAWVQWRRGDRHAGWAPLPPQDVIYDYDDDPEFWVFVGFNNFTAPNIVRVIVPPRERVVYIRETVIVNRTVVVLRDGGDRFRVAVNPGIEPRIVAARVGRPIRVSSVQPVVIAGTVGVQGAREIRADERRDRRGDRIRAEVKEGKETIEPVKDVPPPQALKKGEEARLGDRAPEAAKGAKTVPASEVQDRTKGGADDAAKGKGDDATKAKSDDAAKAKADDAAKSKMDDAAKSRTDDAAKAKSEADAKAKSTDDATKSRTDDAAKAKSKADDAAKSKAMPDDDKGAKAKAPESETKSRDAVKERAEPKQVAPKAEPKSEPKSAPKAEPKAEPKAAPAQKQSAPEPRQAPQRAPEPKQAAPKAAPAPQQAAPKAAPPPQQAAPKAAPPPQAAPKAAPPPAAPKGEEKAK